MSASTPVPVSDGGPLGRLAEAVRAEFAGPVIRVAADDPVFARGVCQAANCPRPAWTRLLCQGHYLRWRQQGQPELATFAASTGPMQRSERGDRIGSFDLGGLGLQARYEVGFVLQCRHDDRSVRLLPSTVRDLIDLLTTADVDSLLDRPLPFWLKAAAGDRPVAPRTVGLLRYGYQRLSDLAEGADAETEFGRDVWRAAALGLSVTSGPRQLLFSGLVQPWLRVAVQQWARFRLGTGHAFSTVEVDVRALRWLSRFLTDCHPDITDAAGMTRPVLEHYLSWLLGAGVAGNSKSNYLVCLRSFLDAARRHGWLPDLAPQAAIYLDDLPTRPRPLPRFAPEYLMAQLGDPANLARLPDATSRHLVVVLIETGLRASDACALQVNPLVEDSVGWPCLRYYNTKMAAEKLVPLSARAAQAIRDQQDHLRERWPHALPPRLFPAPVANPDGQRPISYAALRTRLARWEQAIGLHDEAGQPVRVTAHQFRHTLGTRMINRGVPQHVVQQLLGHASPLMTARYATLHDDTVRREFEQYQQQRVDVTGRRLEFDPSATTADAEWVKHRLARVQASLPNGYCGRPLQNCPHPNACLTCPDFQTTPQFLAIHRRQRDDTLELIALAEGAGRTRQADNHRHVRDNLEQIIGALEAIKENDDDP